MNTGLWLPQVWQLRLERELAQSNRWRHAMRCSATRNPTGGFAKRGDNPRAGLSRPAALSTGSAGRDRPADEKTPGYRRSRLLRRKSTWACVSTPSAITCICSFCASEMIAPVIALSSASAGDILNEGAIDLQPAEQESS